MTPGRLLAGTFSSARREPDPAIGKKEDDGPSLGRGSDPPLAG